MNMKHILATLAFFAKHEGLHTFARTPAMVRAVRSLEKRGFLEVSWETSQARFTGKVFE